jgi:cyclopropane-fatty-acyl-phospholipid synthase
MLSRDGQRFQELIKGLSKPFEVQFANGERLVHGDDPPRFRLTFRDPNVARRILDEFSFADAYVNGQLDIEGDLFSMFDLRHEFTDRFRVNPWLKFWLALLLLDPTRVNKSAIGFHYEYGDEFFLSFTDSKYHLYSHGLFEDDSESLESASERKLQTMFDALKLKPGMRLLDIGGGWGAVTRFCAPRGVEVTSLTLARNSYEHINGVLSDLKAPGQVLLEDFLAHRPREPYDAITILGVIEHIPAYRRYAQRVWDCLKPNGRLYMDASADKMKWDVSQFIRKYIYSGTHSNMCLQDVVRELILNGMRLLTVSEESHSYHLTMRHWAERFDEAREAVIANYGEPLYRAFRLYLWGGAHAFQADILQAYHLVAERGPTMGPRPALRRRVTDFVREQF